MDKNRIIDKAREYKGTPYVHQRRNVAGLDCIGLIITVGLDLGYQIDHSRYAYEKIPNPNVLYGGLDENFTRVIKYQPGDILVFRFTIEPQHVAIYTGDTIIHAYEKATKVVEHRFSNSWRSRVLRAYRYE